MSNERAASPVGSAGVSGPVDGRSVAEIRADLARCDRDGTPWPGAARRLAADVPVLLAEVEAAHRFEVSAGVERDALLAEVERLRGEMRSALLCLRNIGARSGTNLNAWNEAFDVIDAALAAAADAPQPEPAKITYGPRVPSRRVDLGEWDSHRPDFLPDSSSSPVQPADPPTCRHGATGPHYFRYDDEQNGHERCPGPSPAVLPETPECVHGQTEGHWTPLRGAVPVHKTRQECWCPGPAGQAAGS